MGSVGSLGSSGRRANGWYSGGGYSTMRRDVLGGSLGVPGGPRGPRGIFVNPTSKMKGKYRLRTSNSNSKANVI